MRWKVRPEVRVAWERRWRTWFAWLPVKLHGEWIWLEQVKGYRNVRVRWIVKERSREL